MLSGKKVLLVDDDPDDLQLLEEALKTINTDHEIIEAQNGLEGLARLADLKSQGALPCLIVLDLNMPRMDGKSAFIAIKSDPSFSEIPIVIFSTSSSSLDRMFFDRHRTAYLVKPVKVQELSRAASQMMSLCKHRLHPPGNEA